MIDIFFFNFMRKCSEYAEDADYSEYYADPHHRILSDNYDNFRQLWKKQKTKWREIKITSYDHSQSSKIWSIIDKPSPWGLPQKAAIFMRLNIESEVLSYLPTITNVDRWSVKSLTWLLSEINFQIPFSSLCFNAFHLPFCPSTLRMIFHVGDDKIIFATWGIRTSSFPFGCVLVPISSIAGLKSNSSSSRMSDLEGLCASSFKSFGNVHCTGVLLLIVKISTPVFSKITCPGAIHSKFSVRVAVSPKLKEYSVIYNYVCIYKQWEPIRKLENHYHELKIY